MFLFPRRRRISIRLMRLALALAVTALACGDNLRTPVPDSIAAGAVTIETDPLRLVVDAPSGDFVSERFVELAIARFDEPTRYYDPRLTEQSGVDWESPGRVVAVDGGDLVLEGGARLRLGDGPLPGSATITIDPGSREDVVMVRLVFPRLEGEAIFGFGESFRSAVAGGEGDVREMQLRVELESESGINESHVPVPVAQWPGRGVAALVDDYRPGAFDIGSERASAVMATFTRGEPGPLSTHIYTAAEPLDLSRALASITGLPAVPPIWAFAPQQWRNEHESSDEVRADAGDMRALDIPGSVMWIDNPWQTAYNTFEFDPVRFAGANALIEELTALGYKVLVWSTPYVNRDGPTAEEFRDAAAAGYLVTDDRGVPFVFPWQDGPGGLVDFSAPGATEFWRERIERATALGVDGFKLDFGEELVPELARSLTPFRLHAGTAQTLHNAYAGLYHEAYLGALAPGDGFLITRAGALGEQTVNTCVWPGDLDSDFSRHGVDNGEGELNVGGLPAAVAGGLSLSVSGYPFYGSDIGGFREGPPSTETLIRWAQYAALGTIMQLGGGGDNHNPWDTSLYGPEALPIYRTYARLHMDLVPFLYSLARVAGADGTPVTVPTRFLYPDAASDDATFVVGETLFVAPVITEGAIEREVVLPPGAWVDFWTGELVTGDGQTPVVVPAPLSTLPLWQKLDRMLPMFSREADTLVAATAAGVRSYADPAFGRELTWRLAPGGGAAAGSTYDGASAIASIDGSRYVIELAAGERFDRFTLELIVTSAAPPAIDAPAAVRLDGAALPEVTADALADCPLPGCWAVDGPTLRVRSGAGRLEVE